MQKVIACLLLVAGLVLTGCASVQKETPTTGGPVYNALGELKNTYNKPIQQVYAATVESMKDLGINVTQSRADQLTGTVEGKLADGRTVSIDLRSLSQNSTNVIIKVGTLGDETLSRRIMDSVSSKLT